MAIMYMCTNVSNADVSLGQIKMILTIQIVVVLMLVIYVALNVKVIYEKMPILQRLTANIEHLIKKFENQINNYII